MSEKAKLGLVQVYWGNGKGKTTASLGLAIRALGRGLKVHLVQFMKGGISSVPDFEEYGELVSLKKLAGFSHERFGLKEWVVGKPGPEHLEQARLALKSSTAAASSGKYDLVIIDEILYAIQLGLITEDAVVLVIDAKAKGTELVLTGSHMPFKKIFARADLVSEIKKHKHPFDSGIIARRGVEF
ncbi:MAG: cob(I)yrinic acid a,c-diamide adenosyltransferase [archaeon]|nr:cob(I)yrinic acid a,c-diamide adenosyltransferase [archaeon]